MQVKIERFDHQGRGIGYVNNLVTFIPFAIPGDIVDIEITKQKKNYQEGKIVKIIKPSIKRVDAFCPFYTQCGGCSLQNLKYEDTLEYKKDKVKNIFQKINLDIEPIVIENKQSKFYRNKIELQVKNGIIGFYANKTNKIIAIDKCFITNEAINKVIPKLKLLNLKNGKITLRCNQNEEVLIIIETKEDVVVPIEKLKENTKLVGIIVNDKCIYQDNFLIDIINGLVFKYAYDAFFQVNPYVASKLFALIRENIDAQDKVLDLYCGVGTLSLNAKVKAQEVLGIEVIQNAVINATLNAKINKLKAEFVLNKVENTLAKIKLDYNTVIVDPPRSGLDNLTRNIINNPNVFKKIIYVSCDAQTLVRDLSYLKENYVIQKVYLLDMFSYTYHVECLCILNLK